MMNPFENPQGAYKVLLNNEGQYSLWPGFVEVPAGWTSVYGQAGRDECVAYIESHWSDMRPRSLMQAEAALEKRGL